MVTVEQGCFHVFWEGILGRIGSRRRACSKALGWGLAWGLEGSPDPGEKVETWGQRQWGFGFGDKQR